LKRGIERAPVIGQVLEFCSVMQRCQYANAIVCRDKLKRIVRCLKCEQPGLSPFRMLSDIRLQFPQGCGHILRRRSWKTSRFRRLTRRHQKTRSRNVILRI
jgi:hypothetical protein